MKSRLALLFLGFVFLWTAIVFRGTSLKLFPGERLTKQQKRQFETSLVIKAKRGAILDLNQKELAVSVASHSLFADPKLIESKRWVAKTLASILGVSSSGVYKKIKSRDRRFAWIARQLSKQQREKIERLKIKGLGFIEEPKRVYPNNTLFSQSLGFTGRDGFGLEGLEYSFEDTLSGSKKEIVVPRDARGRPLLNDARLLFDVSDGKDVILTVDSEVQFYLEQELALAVKEHEAESAVGIILNAETSEIMAMANSPGYDPNEPSDATPLARKNRAVTDAFEPGSTMKTFVVAAGLMNGTFRPSTTYNCDGGRLKVADRWITEADTYHKWEKLTVSEILAKSSNVGSAKLGFDVTEKKLYEFLTQLGFGAKTDLKFPGVAAGSLKAPPWGKHLLSNISFGHGVSATPLQVATAYAAIANGGVLNPPRLIKGFRDARTGETEWVETPEGQEVLSREVASTLTLILTQATSPEGTGAFARVPGYPVAGKTGTAQKVDTVRGGYIKGEYISSFAGYIPAHAPKYVIYIAVDSPSGKEYYGSRVAAPVFSRVGSYLMRKAGVPPVLITNKNVIEHSENADLQGRALASIKKMLQQNESEGLPDVVGLSLREALQHLRGSSVKVQIKGSGVVVKMDPEQGTPIGQASVVRLQLQQ
jgi:cell division protein FtsI (penicillin-binding protein 3)